MQIIKANIHSREHCVHLTIRFDETLWVLWVTAVNGIVVGDYRYVRTAQFTYHDYSKRIRKANFAIIKTKVEKLLKNKI